MRIDVASVSERGPRADNEDCIGVAQSGQTCVAVIADGLGGMGAGAVASRYAVDRFLHTLELDHNSNLLRIAQATHEEIRARQQLDTNQATMATTLSALVIDSHFARGVHCGDSRVYLVREGRLTRLTEDHVEAERLFRAGKISAQQLQSHPRKNVLESALGMRSSAPRIDEFSLPVMVGDAIFLSTDGFHQKFKAAEIIQYSQASPTAFICCHRLEEELVRRRPDDNYSLVAAFLRA